MNNTSRLIICLIYLLQSGFGFSQHKVFRWETDLCICSGTYDSELYTRDQLQNTVEHLWKAENIKSRSVAWNLEQITELDIEALDEECSVRLKQLRDLDFVHNDFWEVMRLVRINEIENIWELKRFTILGYDDPDTLRYYKYVNDSCLYYIDALACGGEEMMEAWIKQHEEQMKTNGNPDKLHEEFLEMFHSPEHLEYARLELMLFGWWNCANESVPHVDSGWECENEFRSLFLGFDCDCDVP